MAIIVDLQRAEDPRDPVHRAVQALAEGQVVCLPTETVYGLAATALDERAVARLAEIKERNQSSPFALAVKSADAALDFMYDPAPLAQRLARRCWPGPLTLVVPCRHAESAAMRLPPGVRRWVVSGDKMIGLRVVAHRVFDQLLQYCPGPLVLTSANAAGGPPATSGREAAAAASSQVALVLDDGPTRYGGPSTVVRVEGNRFRILRPGVVEAEAVRQFAQPVILLVCTGNTCRSPMAETMLRRRLEEATGQADDGNRLPATVYSAGLAAMPGDPAAPQAVEVLGQMGMDLAGHTSRPLSESLVRSADLILTMTRAHQNAILARWPEAAGRTHTLRRDGGDISDPIGGPAEIYAACARQIDKELDEWVRSLGADWLPSEERLKE